METPAIGSNQPKYTEFAKGTSKLMVNSVAPEFGIADVYGKLQKLSDYKGKKVLLSFHRNVGCPVCNLRFHEIESEASLFKSSNLVLISVYESSTDNIIKYLDGVNPYTIMIPDPSENLYKLYHVEQSVKKLLKGMLKGAISKAIGGMKLQKHFMAQDGNLNRIGADFLINEEGIIIAAHYGQFLGDHLPLSTIKKMLDQ